MVRAALVIALALATPACGGSEESAKYPAAGATLAAGVVGAGLYRATTGGCWGQCLDGTVCDRPSGTCVRVEERTDPSAPRVVRVNCLADEPECNGAGEPHEADVARELVALVLAAPPIELRDHPDAICAEVASDEKSRTLQGVLRDELRQRAEQLGRCTKAGAVSRCTLTLRREGAQPLPDLVLRFDVDDASGRRVMLAATLACSLAR